MQILWNWGSFNQYTAIKYFHIWRNKWWNKHGDVVCVSICFVVVRFFMSLKKCVIIKRYKKCCNIVKNILEVDILRKIDSQISHDNNFLLFPIPFPLELRCGVDVNWFEWEASKSSISILDNWLRLCRCSELVHFEYLPREINSSGKLNSAAIAWPLIWN